MSVPGVANVAVWGERRRRVEVLADPDRLVANGVDLSRLLSATREALTPRAGGLVDLPTTRLPVVQPVVARDAGELTRVPLSTVGRSTLAIGDVATVRLDWGHQTVPGTFECLLLADVAYERVHYEPLLRHVRRCLAPGGRALLGDPFRDAASGFLGLVKKEFATVEHGVDVERDGERVRVRIVEITERST
mgnify:CR=1 FL=1